MVFVLKRGDVLVAATVVVFTAILVVLMDHPHDLLLSHITVLFFSMQGGRVAPHYIEHISV